MRRNKVFKEFLNEEKIFNEEEIFIEERLFMKSFSLIYFSLFEKSFFLKIYINPYNSMAKLVFCAG